MTISSEKYYVGIDVSKTVLDVCILPLNQKLQFRHDSQGIGELIQHLSALAFPVAIVMEATGGYERKLAHQLAQAPWPVSIVNPRQIRAFAKAIGRLAKTDQLDAHLIALFAEKLTPAATVKTDEHQQSLADYNARRRQLVEMINMEKNRLDKAGPEIKASIERLIKALEHELTQLNEQLTQHVQCHPQHAQTQALLVSVKGIGHTAAIALTADLPELGTLTAKQITALVGLAPFNRDSGNLRGKRMIWGGRAYVRTALYMPTLVAIRHNQQIKVFYDKLRAAGKAKKVAIVACMRKLLIIINAMIKHQQPWRFC